MAISQATLRSKAVYFSESVVARNAYSPLRTAFLCHSHHDEDLVKGVIRLFQERNINLYVDWRDHSMPETPNGETARIIRQKIDNTDIFLFLATANSKASRWCPWEIGYADSSDKKIFIIPTEDGRSTYGNEYLQLYHCIDMQGVPWSPEYVVFRPGQSSNGVKLAESVLR